MAVIDTARGHDTVYLSRVPVPVAILGLALVAAALHVVTPFNHDEANALTIAGRLLDGGRFGKDIITMSPPHVFWMAAIPVWLAREIGVRSDIIASFFTAAMAAVSLIASDRLISAGRSADSVPRAFLPIATIVVLFAPGYDYGQREYWMVLLTLPYIVTRSRRVDDVPLSAPATALIGAAACFGFSIKPYCLLAPIAIEIWLLVRTRQPLIWISPETVAMATTGLAYFAVVAVCLPAYFGDELPRVLLGYWAYNGTLSEVLRAAVVLAAPAVVLGGLGYVTLRRGERFPAIAQAFAVVGVAFIIGAVLQMKPWRYHFLPSIIFFNLAAAVLLIGGVAREGASTLRRGALLALIVVAYLPSASGIASRFDDKGTAARVERLAAVFRSNANPNKAVAGFLTSPRDVFPAIIASDTKWVVPFCCDYLIAAAARADERPAAKRQAIRAAGINQARRIIAAIRAQKPGVIVIDAGDWKLGFGNRKFDYVQWLNAHTDFAGVLRRYREISPVGPFHLFVRK